MKKIDIKISLCFFSRGVPSEEGSVSFMFQHKGIISLIQSFCVIILKDHSDHFQNRNV